MLKEIKENVNTFREEIKGTRGGSERKDIDKKQHPVLNKGGTYEFMKRFNKTMKIL